MKRRHIALLPLVLMLDIIVSGCATPYGPQSLTGGYSETQLKEDGFIVRFKGNGYTSEERSSDFALLRCAEIALEHGYSHFLIVNERHDEKESYYTYRGHLTDLWHRDPPAQQIIRVLHHLLLRWIHTCH